MTWLTQDQHYGEGFYSVQANRYTHTHTHTQERTKERKKDEMIDVTLTFNLSVSQDTVLTLEAVTEYSKVIPRTVLNQWINLDYVRRGNLGRVHLNKTIPVVSMKVRVRPALRHTYSC